jgi:hypothetical protein
MIANDGTKGTGGVAVSRPASIRPLGTLLSFPAHVPGPAAQPPPLPLPTAAQNFAQLLQDELLLSRDPHVASRFVELLDQHFDVKLAAPAGEWTPALPPGHGPSTLRGVRIAGEWQPDPPRRAESKPTLHTGPETWTPALPKVR